MRSVVTIAFLVMIGALAGGYSISWFSQSMATKHAIERIIANINEKQPYITYEAIESSGFPSSVFVSIVKPHFNGRIDVLLNALQNGAAASGQTARLIERQWTEDAVLDGKITFGVNALSDHYTLAISGNWQENSTIGGITTSSLHQQLSDFTCTLQMQRSSGIFDSLWNYDAFRQDFKDLTRDFRSVDCVSMGQSTTDTTSKAVLTANGPLRFYMTYNAEADKSHVRLYVKAANMEITPQGDAAINQYTNVLSPNAAFPMNLSIYGKQNIDIDFNYTGPMDWNNTNAAYDITLGKFDITNLVYDTHASLHASNIPTGSNRDSALAFKVESTFNEPYNALVQGMAQNAIKQLYASQDPKLKDTQIAIQNYTPDQLYAITLPLIPNFHSFGQTVLAMDGSFKGSADYTTGDAVLKTFEISSAPYGMTGTGALKLAPNIPPIGTVSLTCSNCASLIDDFRDYSRKAQKVISYLMPAKPDIMPFNPAMLEGFKMLLIAISPALNNEAGQSIQSFTIINNGQSMTINNKPVSEIATLYNQYIESLTPPEAAPSPVK